MPLDPEIAARIGTLQTLDDAIAYRVIRLSLPCLGCTPAGRCIDHLIDTDLIASYRKRHGSISRQLTDAMDPQAAERSTQRATRAPIASLVRAALGAPASGTRRRRSDHGGP